MTDNSIFENKKAIYYTLGCKLNFAETSTIGQQLLRMGIRKAMAGERADICVINTCSVTELADKKCRQAIRRLCRLHQGAKVIVTGCYAQLKPDAVRQIEGVDIVIGTGEKANIAGYVRNMLAGSDVNTDDSVSRINDVRSFSPSCSRGDRTRYFLKVQDGCDYHCTYCTIPYARGRSRNGSIADIVRQAEDAGAEGGREIVLTGVNIGDFGKTTNESFFNLICSLDNIESVERFRISSIEPNLLTDEIIEFMANSKRFAPHFHIPLQSGCDEVLNLMKRRYDTELFADKIKKIKELIPDAFIGVDVIVGTRGETDGFFEETYGFIDSLPVSQLHVFCYSERPGTLALKIDKPVGEKEKHERSCRLIELSRRKSLEFYRSQRGTVHCVLFEHPGKGNRMQGFTENYLRVETEIRESLINRSVPVTLDVLNEESLCFLPLINY
ncbi:MAG: tRNA (N(6)-L-threonylcarbamoyladenosine(37)-C(2))-methylthiotransferase MtaB [Dysgonamonadaceae bacterium]|jgi:threonylcarbamoyladenosine tRNA methylthiotransferase MtaB|nr:tRNA (N(6)-L-threonylcarbamoyladenosine(37)-C(2))-methylthiotransferase MtaB [Dysgonamonadaceae bacterium]